MKTTAATKNLLIITIIFNLDFFQTLSEKKCSPEVSFQFAAVFFVLANKNKFYKIIIKKWLIINEGGNKYKNKE